jgi:hypothetical protein
LTLSLKPKGRGRWTPVTLSIESPRAAPLLVRAGQLLTLGGVVWRICKVTP